MHIVVPIKLVPDLVDDLEIDETGTALDMTWLRLIVNEVDEHALEQALLLKESSAASISVLSLEGEGVDDVLFASAAKGADRLIRLSGADFESGVNNHALARAYAEVIGKLDADLVLVGVQAHNDLDGALGPLLAETLGLPYVGYVSGVALGDGNCSIRKEYPGGLIAQMEVSLPAVLGVQSAESPPRYVAISRIRQAMNTTTVDEEGGLDFDPGGGPTVDSMFTPETGERAAMLEGDEEEVAALIIDLLRKDGKV